MTGREIGRVAGGRRKKKEEYRVQRDGKMKDVLVSQ